MGRARWIGWGVVAAATVVWAQKIPVTAPPTGTVTGHVICADTQRPARLAQVTLARKPDDAMLAPDADPFPEADAKHPAVLLVIDGRSGMDGSFSFSAVPPGDYYVLAKMAGYIVPLGKSSSSTDVRAQLDEIMRDVPVVHVVADHTATVDLSTRRGGAITGRMQFDDGTPVVGMNVSLQPEKGRDTLARLPFYLLRAVDIYGQDAATDDEGRFRITGIAPGTYIMSSELQFDSEERTNSDGSVPALTGKGLIAFAPGAFHKSEARVFEFKGAEQEADANFEVDLDKLHTVRGRVLAKEDLHRPNHFRVKLIDEADKEFYRIPMIAADGSFHFDYVPAGTYTVRVFGAADAADPKDDSEKEMRSYAELKVSVIVLDKDATMDDILLGERKSEAPKDE